MPSYKSGMTRAVVFWFFISVALPLCAAGPGSLLAQSEKIKTATYVKVQAIATKPNDAGHQVVAIAVEIDEKFILIGDKVPEDMAPSRFRVKFIVNGKPAEAEIVYPRGKLQKGEGTGDYTIYEGKVVCTGTIQRVAGGTSPIEVVITMQGFPQTLRY